MRGLLLRLAELLERLAMRLQRLASGEYYHVDRCENSECLCRQDGREEGI